jgi:multisubunit Na+/H+ antiporter MnhB subunit
MDDYFIARAQEERAVNNVVTSIVFDYRGFDTLGEGAVLFTAVTSVVALFRKGRS